MVPGDKLSKLRGDIDGVDRDLVELVSRRAALALEIGKTKSTDAKAVLDVVREKEVLEAIARANPGPLSDRALKAIFREIVSACREAQEPSRVVFLGPCGTFSHEAALKQFGETAVYEPVDTIGDVFVAVENGRAAYGVVPVENTTEGAVTPTLDALARTSLRILAELEVKVDHYLMSVSGDRSKIRRVISHPQPLAQCRRFLGQQLAGVKIEQAASTAAAAQLAARHAGTAAIASRIAAQIYDLKVIVPSIQDSSSNVTRFLVVADTPKSLKGAKNRTSLVVSVRDEVGILERLLRPFAANGVNLSMLESRPLQGRPWEYSFFIDVCGHIEDPDVSAAVAEVEKLSLSTSILGSYPTAD
ncbi:MAG: prephenate dehydratase [Candidatus Binatia bacterium]